MKLDPTIQESLLVYPLNDVREDKEVNVENCRGSNFIAYPVGSAYMVNNFDAIVTYASQKNIEQNITYWDLNSEDTKRLKIINTGGKNYVLILYLRDFRYYLSYLRTFFTTSIEGFLVRVNTGQVVWKDEVRDTINLGVLTGAVDRAQGTIGYKTTCQQYGIVLANLLRSFPKLTKSETEQIPGSIVRADKDVYNQGETITVNFSNAPGIDADWICIIPAGSPVTDAGDFKYMPKGVSQGSLVFDPPIPGKYEVRAYYNYSRYGYKTSGHYTFSVIGSP